MFSCRMELDAEMEKLNNEIQLANAAVGYSDDDEALWKEGVKAESLLPLLLSLCDDEKFRSVQQIQKEIDQLTVEIRNTMVIQDKIPIGRKIQKLKSLLELNGVTRYSVGLSNEDICSSMASKVTTRAMSKANASAPVEEDIIIVTDAVQVVTDDYSTIYPPAYAPRIEPACLEPSALPLRRVQVVTENPMINPPAYAPRMEPATPIARTTLQTSTRFMPAQSQPQQRAASSAASRLNTTSNTTRTTTTRKPAQPKQRAASRLNETSNTTRTTTSRKTSMGRQWNR